MTFTKDLGLSIRVSMFEYMRLVTGSSSLHILLLAHPLYNSCRDSSAALFLFSSNSAVRCVVVSMPAISI